MTLNRAADRDEVWKVLQKYGTDREGAAKELGISFRTLGRRLEKFNLYPDMDKAGLVQRRGPPRKGREPMWKQRAEKIKEAVKEMDGVMDYGRLSIGLFGEDSPRCRQMIHIEMNQLRNKGILGFDGEVWFVI